MFSVIFPGQGSQVVGMGKEFYEKFDFVKKLFRQADEVLEYNLSKIIFPFSSLRFVFYHIMDLFALFPRTQVFRNLADVPVCDYGDLRYPCLPHCLHCIIYNWPVIQRQ